MDSGSPALMDGVAARSSLPKYHRPLGVYGLMAASPDDVDVDVDIASRRKKQVSRRPVFNKNVGRALEPSLGVSGSVPAPHFELTCQVRTRPSVFSPKSKKFNSPKLKLTPSGRFFQRHDVAGHPRCRRHSRRRLGNDLFGQNSGKKSRKLESNRELASIFRFLRKPRHRDGWG